MRLVLLVRATLLKRLSLKFVAANLSLPHDIHSEARIG
jgi:hypothetical protein